MVCCDRDLCIARQIQSKARPAQSIDLQAKPNRSLRRIQSDPSAPVLVQTDPRFTNYKSWLSSDYITTRTGLDRMAGLYVAGPGTLLVSCPRVRNTSLTRFNLVF